MKRNIVYTYIALYLVLIYIFGNIFDNSSLETQISLGIMAATPVIFVIAVIHIICRLLSRRKKKSSPSKRNTHDHHGPDDTRTSYRDNDGYDNDSNDSGSDSDGGGGDSGGGDGGGGDGGD